MSLTSDMIKDNDDVKDDKIEGYDDAEVKR